MELLEIPALREGKNLLAFSGGVDSTALFFLLHERAIPFDIALVNYRTRAESDLEEAYAQELASTHGKACFIHRAPRIPEGNFEHLARTARYTFFEEIINRHGYKNLLLAHQLNDRLEWFLMRLLDGSGLNTLLGSAPVETRAGYQIVRPLYEVDRDSLYAYLHERKIRYFEDSSNQEAQHRRNTIRHTFATPLLQRSPKGILASLQFLAEEQRQLYPSPQAHIQRTKQLFFFVKQQEARLNLYFIDYCLKRLGKVMSQGERAEVVARDYSLIIGHQWAIDSAGETIYIAPFSEGIKIPREERERLRRRRIPPKVRPYCFLSLESSGATW